MDHEQIYRYLYQFNKGELFYRSCHEVKKQPEGLQSFLDSQDPAVLQKMHIIIPELLPDSVPRLMPDDAYFDKAGTRSVYLSKHNRYTPAFEHKHIFFEMLYVLSGTCTHRISDQDFTLTEGDLCLVSPSITHSVLVMDDSLIINILIRRSTISDIFFNVLRDPGIISSFFNSSLYMNNHTAYLLFHTKDDTNVKNQILDMFIEQLEEDLYSDRIISSMLILFFTRLMRSYNTAAELPPYTRKNEKNDFPLLNYFLDHYSTVTLAELAGKLNYSIPYCSRYIKECTGCTFTRLIKKIRFQRSENMLLSTSMAITAISEALGYDNPENFIRAFKKEYGISPAQYRACRR